MSNPLEKCSYCNGHGVKYDKLCIYCKATGKIDWTDNIGIVVDEKINEFIKDKNNIAKAYSLRMSYKNLSIEAKKMLEKIICQDPKWACYLIIDCEDLSIEAKKMLEQAISKNPCWLSRWLDLTKVYHNNS